MFNSAITNIVSNCIKFTPQGGTIAIAVREAGTDEYGTELIEIRIKDTGVGMEQVIADHVFDPQHFHTTKGTDKESGTGLGMVLVGDVIRIHNGSIRAVSSPGNGTEFIILLPKNPAIEETFQ
jgi:signal transduction histidine kinase